MSTIRVRPACRTDVERLVDFQMAMAYETESLQLNRDTVTRGVTAVLDDPGKGQYLVAESEGEVCGSLLITYEWSDWRNGCVAWIQSVYVVPWARRRGVFRALFEHVRDMVVVTRSFIGLRLYVDCRNELAQQVYRKLGMDGDHYRVWEWFPEAARALQSDG